MRGAGLLSEVVRLDRSRIAVGPAVSGAIGFTIPLAVGLATDRVGEGVTASVGALIVGFANLGGAYRARALTLLATTLAASVAALLGGVTGGSTVVTVFLVGVWGFAGGLLVALGPRAAYVGMLSTWALLLAADLHLHGTAAVESAALIAAGGLLQTAVAVVAWPLRPDGPEQRALSAAYRALAAAAREPTPQAAATSAATLTAAVQLIGDGSGRARQRAIAEQGEWIRLEILALGACDDHAAAALLTEAAGALDALAAGRRPDVVALRAQAAVVTRPEARAPANMLAARIAMDINPPASERRGVAPRSALAAGLIALRAQLTPRSSAFRHAIRLAVALIVAVIVYRAMGLGRGFWVPLTVLFVLKPDYLATYARGIGRAAGTVLGVVLAATIVALGHPSDPVALGLLAALALVAYAVFSANYALFSLTLTVLVALVVVFAGGSAIGAIEDRIVDTAIGAVIALTTFALWPTREDETLRRRLGELVAAHVRWLEAITAGLADPDAYDPTSMRRERLATRVARTNAEASLQRAAGEPASRRSAVSAASGLIDGMASLDGHFLVLAELAHDDRTSGPRPAIGSWSRALDARLQALVEHTAVPGVLRETTLALIDAARTHPNNAALTVVATQATAILAVVEGLPSVSA